MAGPQTCQTAETTAAMEGESLLLLKLLPHTPAIVRVLSYLPVQTLAAVVLAYPHQMGALSKANKCLWPKGARGFFEFKDIEGLLDLLRVGPPLDSLLYDDRFRSPFQAGNASISLHFGCPRDALTPCLLKVRGPSMECLSEVIGEFGSELKNLEMDLRLFGGELQVFLASLRDATALETLALRWCDQGEDIGTAMWPHGLVLPGLHKLHLEARTETHDKYSHRRHRSPNLDCSLLVAVRSLIEAHCAQLRTVVLGSSKLMPLLDSCAATLEDLTVRAEKGVFKALRLQNMHGLKRLSILLGSSYQVQDVMDLFMLGQPVELTHLYLEVDERESLRALGGGRLTNLTNLWVKSRMDVGIFRGGSTMDTALNGLPKLRMLVVDGLLKRETLELLPGLSSDAIHKLRVVKLEDNVGSDYEGYRVGEYLVAECPQPLHVVMRIKRFFPRSTVSRVWTTMFSRHSIAKEESCLVCQEYVGNHGAIDQHVQVK